MSVLLRRFYQLLANRNWLTVAAMQVIIDAFGTDGIAVIGATNAYLNGIAMTYKSKARDLAAFINEDPMMVCSLGLSVVGVTMPIRWLVGDGNSRIETNITPQNGLTIESIVSGAADGTGAYYSVVHQFNGAGMWFALSGATSFNVNFDIGPISYSDLRQGKNVVSHTFNGSTIVNGVNKGYKNSSANSSHPIPIMAQYDIKSETIQSSAKGMWMAEFKPKLNGTVLGTWVPFVSQTRNGMVDLDNIVFHPNAGTGAFTSLLTQQDGVTPWTPGT